MTEVVVVVELVLLVEMVLARLILAALAATEQHLQFLEVVLLMLAVAEVLAELVAQEVVVAAELVAFMTAHPARLVLRILVAVAVEVGMLPAQQLAAAAAPVSSSLDAINKVRHER